MRGLKYHVETAIWQIMTKSIRWWANHYMDQFDSFKFKDICDNDVYVSISYYSEWPNSFRDLDNPSGWPLPEVNHDP